MTPDDRDGNWRYPARRACLRGLLGFAGTLALGASPWGAAIASCGLPKTRTLSLRSLHTEERLTATYLRDGKYDSAALQDIDAILRDWRTEEVWSMDRDLLDLLFAVQQRTGSRGAVEVISGYRSPKTNAKLAAGSKGVAKRSLHMQGRAIDIRFSDRRLADLHDAALSMKAGGVGLYSKSGFVHLDTGRVRRWGS